MQGNIYPVKMLIEGIRNSPSSDPTKLPLRQKGQVYPEWVDKIESRLGNKSYWKNLRSLFCNKLFGAQGNEPGLYFFVSSINEKYPFYYIGISTEGKSYNVSDRVDEHLLEKDYYFYMLAQPNNKIVYHEEALKFYFAHGQKYHKKIDEFERQYDALKKVSTISSIAWVTNSNFTVDDWESIESFFVTIYKPPANSKKLNEPIDHPLLSKYKSKYEEVKNYLYEKLLPCLNGSDIKY